MNDNYRFCLYQNCKNASYSVRKKNARNALTEQKRTFSNYVEKLYLNLNPFIFLLQIFSSRKLNRKDIRDIKCNTIIEITYIISYAINLFIKKYYLF